MCNTVKRFYSPQFSELAAVSVRRFAWAINKPMTETVEVMVKLMSSIIDPSKVCLSCQDSGKCQECIFCKQVNPDELTALEAVIQTPAPAYAGEILF